MAQLLAAALAVICGQGLAVEQHLPAARWQQPGDHPGGCGLARTGFSHHGHCAPLVDIKADILEHIDRPVARGDIAHGDNRGAVTHGRLFLAHVAAHRPERFCIILLGGGQHGGRVSLFDLFPLEQHFDFVGHLGHDGEVMGDVDRSRVELLDDVADRCQHLDLGGHVEGGGRLVKDDQIRAAGHCHGGHGALQLPARDLMRIAKPDFIRVGQLHASVEVCCVALRLAAGHYAMLNRGL